MAYEYRHIRRPSPRSNQSHAFTVFGKPFMTEPNEFEDSYERRPMANVGVSYKPGKFIIPWQQEGKENRVDPNNVTGLSEDYLSGVVSNIYVKNEEDLTGDDEDAENIIRRLNSDNPQKQAWAEQRYDKAVNDWQNPHFYPEKLFEHKPSSMTIDSMFSDPSMRSSAMTLAALAKRRTGAQVVRASDDLSEFSSRLTKSAMERGLPVVTHPHNPDARITNMGDLIEQSTPSEFINEENYGPLVPVHEVEAAKRDLREMLRPQKTVRNAQPVTSKGLSQQFLPGMEGFV